MNFKELFELDDRTYDRLKYIVLIVMPALATFTGVIGLSFGWPATDLIITIMTAVITLLGTVLGISSYNYESR